MALPLLASAGRVLAKDARPFLHPDRIRYDSQCLTIDGKDVFIYGGAFHFFRCPKELWPDRFQKIKDAGFNCVETYVAWNWCEREMPAGTNDFSKANLTDLDDFLKMAEQYGLYVIVRPGPYICAEWDTGGFPQWLLTKRPEKPLRSEGWLRTDDPVYLGWCRHWFDAVCPVIAKHQITRKPPGQPGVILVQVENEYDFATYSDTIKINQVKALTRDALADGIEVPIFTCWTHQVRGSDDPVLRHVFDCSNFYPRWNVEGELGPGIEKLRREQPDAPLATTELQGGWFSQVGGKLSEDQEGVTASQINNLTLFAIQSGDTLLNYYMLYGGLNPGDWGARNMTTTYDYNAPIREWGGVGERYQRVWALGHMLREHGAKLARSMAVDCDFSASQNDVAIAERRATDGARYLFVRTPQHAGPREGTATVREKSDETSQITFDYKLEPFGSTILYLPPGTTNAAQGKWLPEPAPAISQPTDLPPSVTINTVRSRSDPGPLHWTKLQPGEDLAHAGVYDSRFIFYHMNISTKTPTNLLVKFPNEDSVLATVNGRRAASIGKVPGGSAFALSAGSSKVQLLHENPGHYNFGPEIDQSSGILAVRLTSGTFGAGKPITGWRMHEVDGTTNRPEIKTEFHDVDWKPITVDSMDANSLPAGHAAVYRADIQMAATDLNGEKLILSFGRIDDLGWIYVNGEKVGETVDWSHTSSFDVTKQLHAGDNIIAVVVKNNDGTGGIGVPAIAQESDGPVVPRMAFGNPAGVDQQWWKPDLDDRHWGTLTIGLDSSETNVLLTWYRMKFQLPTARTRVRVPWRLHLNARGNGFLYLNGHALGRYWEAGPQHDFYLPECWLNLGKDNNLTLNLRPLDHGASIQAAVVEPYAEIGEQRGGDDRPLIKGQSETDENYERLLDNWYQKNDPASTARPAWNDPALDASNWKTMSLPQPWEMAGLPDYDGVVWFRKELNLPGFWSGKNAVLHLGAIDDQDTTWVNGVRVGGMHEYNDARDYAIPGSLLKAGRNIIAIRVLDTGGPGGIDGDAEQMRLEIPGENQLSPISLAGTWQYLDSVALAKASPVPLNPAIKQGAGHNFEQWEKEIAAFEASDRTNPPPPNAVLFIGSSTIRLWTTLAQDFPGQRVINRGFGGSEVVDSTHFADRILFPYAPRAIFFRAGGNDIAAGRSPEAVFEDFKEFVSAVHAKLPEADVFYISWNPTIARWQNRDKEKILNDHVKEYAQKVLHLQYIETGDLVLGADGLPRPELFRTDKLHFSAAGYKLLAERVRPFLPK